MKNLDVKELLINGSYDALIIGLINKEINDQLINEALEELSNKEKQELKNKWFEYMQEDSNFMSDEIDNVLADLFKTEIANKL